MPSVHLGRLLPLRVEAVVFTVAIEELIGKELLYSVEQELHEAGDLRFDSDFEYVEVFIGAQFLGVLVLFHLVQRSLAQRDASPSWGGLWLVAVRYDVNFDGRQ